MIRAAELKPGGNAMTTETAGVVLASITAVGALIWLIALRFLIAASHRGRAGQQAGADEAAFSEEGREGWFVGSTEVEGDVGTLAARAAAVLAAGNPYTFGSVKVLEKSDARVCFERVEGMVSGRPASQWFRRGELRFTPLRAGRTRIDWAVEPESLRWLLRIGVIFQIAGLLALVGGCWAIYAFIASSPIPAVRWQTIQMVQAIHFLWPPFLFGALYGRGTKGVAAQFEALANNLPYYDGRAA
jgi:hypothetical protein